MKFIFEKLGPIFEGELTLSDLTILCGKNNTGKTYVTNAIYSCFTNVEELFRWNLPHELEVTLYENAVATVDLNDVLIPQIPEIIKNASSELSKRLGNYFACSSDLFTESIVNIVFNINDRWITEPFDTNFRSSSGKTFLSIKKPENSSIAEIISTDVDGAPPIYILDDAISNILISIVLKQVIPKTFIASAERTGASIFKNELNFNKNQLIRFISDMDKNQNGQFSPYDIVRNFKRNYAISVEQNVEFIASISNLVETNNQSKFIKENQHLLKKFEDIAGGTYISSKEGVLSFIPNSSKKSRLGLGESSSAVRSLMIIWYWLNYKADKNDLLMIDEPELNLHPENQRKFAQFIAALINSGIKVFMTTHSDYIIRELNSLIMLNCEKPHIKFVREKFGYSELDILDKDRVAIYNTCSKLLSTEGSSKRRRLGSLEKWEIENETGIKIPSFDDQISLMNEIQDALLYGL